MLDQRVGQVGALLDVLAELPAQGLDPLLLGLVHERGEGLVERDAGAQERRQLPGHPRHDVDLTGAGPLVRGPRLQQL